MDCRCRKLSLFFCKFLSAVGVLEQDCRYIFGNFGAMSLVAKPLGRPLLISEGEDVLPREGTKQDFSHQKRLFQIDS